MVKPFGGFSLTWLDGFSSAETGAGNVNLTVRRRDDTHVDSILGTEFSAHLSDEVGNSFSPFASLAWRHALTNPDRNIDATFAAAPAGAPGFTVRGNEDRDRLEAKAGLTVRFTNGLIATASWQGEFSRRTESHTGQLQLIAPF